MNASRACGRSAREGCEGTVLCRRFAQGAGVERGRKGATGVAAVMLVRWRRAGRSARAAAIPDCASFRMKFLETDPSSMQSRPLARRSVRHPSGETRRRLVGSSRKGIFSPSPDPSEIVVASNGPSHFDGTNPFRKTQRFQCTMLPAERPKSRKHIQRPCSWSRLSLSLLRAAMDALYAHGCPFRKRSSMGKLGGRRRGGTVRGFCAWPGLG